MKLVKTLASMLFLGLFGQAALAQCCCSGAHVEITSGAFPLPKREVTIKQIFAKDSSEHISFSSETDARFRFYVGCGNGKETLTVEYMDVVMRIRFKLHGDFGSPKGEIPFQTGDYIAEFAKESEDEGGRKLVFRPATAEEMKEVEPEPESAADGLLDQTADAL